MKKASTYLFGCAVAAALGGAALIAGPAAAGPLSSSAPEVKAAAPSGVIMVQGRRQGWRGHDGGRRHGGRGAGIAAGLAAGAIFGAAAAAAASQPYYEPSYGGYYGGYYGAPSGYYGGPGVVYEQAPGARCWVSTDRDRGYGYWGRC
ncbi:MAG: hypothetical protein IRZ09_02575 [Variibacter sp.]|nr:hypothetical protein [Variibacter sp.]